ncbi:helicase [Synechococcus phage metaG-MbCM1]|jgi:hypothetical protein|uniref:Helicase n=1 Tax=Synechococcus phage metaG-MbCM1 TaxID=1079999 RepID=H8ZN42_9CAUD|nr:helicase [Synechococcus phage metaG-MbCM1]AFD02903.1 helicase [Synechococcus phage metaG-MbCM1]
MVTDYLWMGRNKTQLLKFDLNATERNLESFTLVCFDILNITKIWGVVWDVVTLCQLSHISNMKGVGYLPQKCTLPHSEVSLQCDHHT